MQTETRVTTIDCSPYRLPFVNSFATAHGAMKVREGAIVEISTSDGVTGIGEIAPLPAFGSAPLATVLRSLPALTVQLCGLSVHEALSTVLQRAQQFDASLICGLEMALLDAWGKSAGCTVSALLARRGVVPCTEVAVNAVVGAQTIEGAVQAAQEAQRQGFGCVKLKVGSMGSVQEEIERVGAVRAAIGPEMQLHLDANEAWTLAEAIEVLALCQPYDIQYVEQPLSRCNLEGMHTLRWAVAIPIAADEAVGDLLSARRVIEQEAADILIIKPQLAGGLRMGQSIIDEAAQHGVQAVITTTIESGVSLAAALHLAAVSPQVTQACGLATGHLLADDLIVDELAVEHGVLVIPTGAGLGVTLDRVALHSYHAIPEIT